MSLEFLITANNSDFKRKLDEIRNGTSAARRHIEREGRDIDNVFAQMAQGAAILGVGAGLKEFATQVATVRGQFQQLEVAFRTMLGSKEKADALMSQLIRTAATTPFQMSDIAGSAKQLLAYGLAADEVNDTLVRLGDIAAGLSIPIQDLAYLYGTTMVQGRLYTQDLNQFLGRGIPLVKELAGQFGVAESEVKQLVEKGKVGFPQVEAAIRNLTKEGSQFGGLMEAQSKTITGQISNIEDSIEQMLNEIGKQSEGFISDTLTATQGLIENWETIGKVLLTLITTYGAYKAAVIAVMAAHRIAGIIQATQAFLQLARGIKTAKDAMVLFNIATKANPLGLILGVVAAAATAFYLFRDSANEAATATERVEQAQKELDKQVGKEVAQIDLLFKSLQNAKKGTEAYDKAKKEILSNYGSYLQGLGKEVEQLDNVRKAYDAIRTAALNAAKARVIEKATSQAAEDLVKQQGEARAKVAEMLRKKHGKRTVKNANGQRESLVDVQLRSYDRIVEGKVSQENVRKWIRSIDGDKVSGWKWLKDELVYKHIQKATQAQTTYNETLRLTEERFGKIEIASQKASDPKPTPPASSPDKKGRKSNKAVAEAERLAKEQEQREQAIKAYHDSVAVAEREAELDLQAQRIDLMNEGLDKQRAQIALNYDRLTHENRKRAAEMLKALVDVRLAEWQQQNPKATDSQALAKKSAIASSLTTSDLSKGQREQLAAYDNIALQFREKQERDLLKNLLDQHRNYEQQRKDISHKANKEIAALQQEALEGRISPAALIAASEQIQREAQKATQDLHNQEANETARHATLMVEIFEDASTKSRQQIDDILLRAQQLLDYLRGQPDVEIPIGISPQQAEALRHSPEQVKALTDAVLRLRQEAEGNLHPFERLTKTIRALFKAQKEGDKKGKSEGLQKLGKDVTDAAAAASGLLDTLAAAFEQGGDSETAQNLKATGQAIQDVAGIGSALAKGDYVGAAIQTITTAINLFGIAAKAEADHQKALSRLREQAIAQQHAYNAALFDTALALDRMGELGEDAYGKMLNAAELIAQKQRELQDKLFSLQHIQIKVGSHVEGILWWRKQVDEYGSLLDRFPELIDKAGRLNLDYAKSVLSTAEFRDESAKVQLQRIIDTAEQEKKASEAVSSYVESVFGQMGDAITNALVDAFRNGTDASQAFVNSASDMIEKLAIDIAKSTFLTPIIEQASKQAKEVMQDDSLSSTQRITGAASVLADAIREASAAQEQVNELLAEVDQQVNQQGFDLFKPGGTNVSGEKSGFATASQQSIDELNGRFAALQISGAQTSVASQSTLQAVREGTLRLTAIDTRLDSTNRTLTEMQQLDALRNEILKDIYEVQHRYATASQQSLSSIYRTLKEKL